MKKNQCLRWKWLFKWKSFFHVLGLTIVLSLGSFSGYGARISRDTISLDLKEVKLEKFVEVMKEKTGLNFLYNSLLFKDTEPISVVAKMEHWETVLRRVLDRIGFTYDVKDEIIVISRKAQNATKQSDLPHIVIQGRVVDVNKQPIPGVTVRVRLLEEKDDSRLALTLGTVTNQEGYYKWMVNLRESFELVFSFIGMETQVIRYTGQDSINVVLKEAVSELGEINVVSTGYQNVNRRDMVGSFSSVKADDIKIAGVSNMSDLLQGQIPGMIVTRTSSRAGSSPKIKIRGTTTLGNTDPLFVVDGIIQDDPIRFNATIGTIDDMENIIGDQVSWLNPSDIETITVLKDASATAVYGSRASNGVIVITTKKPKSGDRLSINYSGSLSVSPRPTYSRFNLMNSQERVHFSEEAYAAGAKYATEPIPDANTFEGVMRLFLAGNMQEEEYLRKRNDFETMNTNWLKILTRTAITHSHNLSVGGASDKATYMFSTGYNKEEGMEKGNSSERLTARASINMNLRRNMRLAFNINGSVGKNVGYANGVNPLNYATTISRAIPCYEENGSLAYYYRTNFYLYNKNNRYLSYNILNEMENSESSVKSGKVSMGLDFSWHLTEWLTYQLTGGYSYNSVNTERFSTERSFYVANAYRGYDYGTVDASDPWYAAAQLPNGGELFSSSATQHSYNIQNKLLIQKTFGDDHRLNVMLGTEVRSSRNNNVQTMFFGYVPDRGHVFVKPTPPQNVVPVGAIIMPSEFGILNVLYNGRSQVARRTDNFFSLFATLAYSLKNRYVFNFSFRNDESNRFGQDVNGKFDPTYSFGGAWRVSEETWMAGLAQVISDLNLKATYGIQGNANLSKSPDLILGMRGIKEQFNSYYSNIVSIPNPNLSWERTHTWDFGLDLRLFNRVNVAVDYYTRKSNAVIEQDIPYLNGRDKMSINGGILYNRGIEMTVSFNPVNKKDFGLNVSVNSSKNWNKGGETPFEATYVNYLTGIQTSVLKKGYPVGAFWSYSFAGLSSTDGSPLFNNMDIDEETAKADPTTVLVYSGSQEPDFTGGLNLGVRYKAFTLNTSFSLLLGGHKRLKNPFSGFSYGVRLPEAQVNLSKELNKRWQKPGDENVTDIPAILTGKYWMNTPFQSSVNMITDLYAKSDALVVSSSFLRCRNLALSWRMNHELLKKLNLSSFTVSASVSNLFVVASKRYHGFDPELNESVMPKSYSLSLNIGF